MESFTTIAISQLPIEEWHGVIGDAIQNQLVHNADKITLREATMRKQQAKLTATETSEKEEKPRVATLRWVAALLRSGWQASRGMGGNLQRFTQVAKLKENFPLVYGRQSVGCGDWAARCAMPEEPSLRELPN